MAPINCSVLLLGETGTGKELFARALHERSRRRARALVRVNCAALPPTLIESELFGHEKGAFTGAVSMRQGRFELADGGTIFLDEIGDLPLDMQVKLLRVLQEGEFERVGSSRTRKVDVRVIAATHHDLEAGDREGHVPRRPLLPAERVSDPPAAAARAARGHPAAGLVLHPPPPARAGPPDHQGPDAGDDRALQHDWPGNVRELENVVERAMIRSTGDTLQLDIALRRQAARRPARISERRPGRGAAGAHRERARAVRLAHQRPAMPPSGSASIPTRCASA